MSFSDRPMTGGPVDRKLERLIDRGYRFIHPRDNEGQVLSVVGVRPHGTVIDVVWINGQDDVVAKRMPGSERDVLEPNKVLWRSAGDADRVLDELLALPDGVEPPAGAPVRGCWVPVNGGRAKWLAATG